MANDEKTERQRRLFVGNFPFAWQEEDLKNLFAEFGEVNKVAIILDSATKRSRGFAYVQIEDSLAEKAIRSLDGKVVEGRALRVNVARPRVRNS